MFYQAEEMRFGKPYAHVQTVDIGPGITYDKTTFVRNMVATKNVPKMMASLIKVMSSKYERGNFKYSCELIVEC